MIVKYIARIFCKYNKLLLEWKTSLMSSKQLTCVNTITDDVFSWMIEFDISYRTRNKDRFV